MKTTKPKLLIDNQRKGGNKTFKLYGKAYMKALGKKGAESRWGKKKLKAKK